MPCIFSGHSGFFLVDFQGIQLSQCILHNVFGCFFRIRTAEENDGCDGDAWEFEANGMTFDLGYIYDSELEKIAEILLMARK